MSEDLIFYTNPMSRGRIARWMLEEVGVPYRTELIEYGEQMKSEAYRSVNPLGKVPAIQHGETIVTETAAVCAYLADAFPDAGLAPPLQDRGAYYRWLFFAAGPVETAVTEKSMGLEVPEGKQAMSGYGTMDAVLEALEQAVSQSEYIAGPRFSAADLYVGSQIGWGLQFGTIESRPAFVEYSQRLTARPAWLRAKELDDAAMPT